MRLFGALAEETQTTLWPLYGAGQLIELHNELFVIALWT